MSLADGLAIVLFIPVSAALLIHIHALFTPPSRRKILTLALIYTGIYLLLLGLIHLIVGNVGILPFFILDFLPNHNLHDNPIKSQTCRAIVCCPTLTLPHRGRGLID